MSVRYRANHGFSLVSALFVLVVLTTLGTYMVSVSSVQHMETAFSLEGARAEYAALSAMEWAVNRVRSTDTCLTIPTQFTTSGFTTTVTACNAQAVTEGAASFNVFDLQVSATRGTFGTPSHVFRRLRVTVQGP